MTQTTAVQNNNFSNISFIISVCIMGSVPGVCRFIPLPSPVISCSRSILGTISILICMLLIRHRPDLHLIRKYFFKIFISGIFLGINWILLFEAFNHTTVAIASLCNQLAPLVVVMLSPFLFNEKLTRKSILCIIGAGIGIILISGNLSGSIQTGSKGIFLALGSSAFYGIILIINKTVKEISAFDTTLVQLISCSIVLTPYILLTQDLSSISLLPFEWGLVLLLGIVHTGMAYTLYFGSMEHMKAQAIGILSYIGCVISVLISFFLFKETMTVLQFAGAVLIFTAAIMANKNNQS